MVGMPRFHIVPGKDDLYEQPPYCHLAQAFIRVGLPHVLVILSFLNSKWRKAMLPYVWSTVEIQDSATFISCLDTLVVHAHRIVELSLTLTRKNGRSVLLSSDQKSLLGIFFKRLCQMETLRIEAFEREADDRVVRAVISAIDSSDYCPPLEQFDLMLPSAFPSIVKWNSGIAAFLEGLTMGVHFRENLRIDFHAILSPCILLSSLECHVGYLPGFKGGSSIYELYLDGDADELLQSLKKVSNASSFHSVRKLRFSTGVPPLGSDLLSSISRIFPSCESMGHTYIDTRTVRTLVIRYAPAITDLERISQSSSTHRSGPLAKPKTVKNLREISVICEGSPDHQLFENLCNRSPTLRTIYVHLIPNSDPIPPFREVFWCTGRMRLVVCKSMVLED